MALLRDWYVDVRKRYKIGREKPQLWHFEQHGFGYIQIPKVATRSIRQALLNIDQSGNPEGNDFATFEAQNSTHLKHVEIRKYVDQGLFLFAFVRDPYARIHSAWVNKIVDAERKGEKNILRCHGMHFGMSFKDFVVRVSELADNQIDRHMRSQAWFLADAQGLLPQYVGRLEDFNQHWSALRESLPVLGPVDHINKAAHAMDYLAAYDEQSLRLVTRRYAKDFELFGYQPLESDEGLIL